MKLKRRLLQVAGLTLSVALASGLIWWRINASGEPRWKDTPENRARVLAEARINGWITAATHTDGTKYYFWGSTKYMYPIRAEELDYFWLWRENKDAPEEMRGKGTAYIPFEPGPKTYRTFNGENVELDLTPDSVAPGTTVEELLDDSRK